MVNESKAVFIRENLIDFIHTLTAESKPLWGVMNAQQMIEHLSNFFDVSTQRRVYELVTPEEQIPKYKQFLWSDKQFRENTKAPANIIGDEPLPFETPDINSAKEKLKESINYFFTFFKERPDYISIHPVFGPLNFEEWVLLHEKHVQHHRRQFGGMGNSE